MAFEVCKLSKSLGAEVKGLDLREALNPSIRTKINDAFVENVVLVFRNQNLTAQQFLAAAKQLGQPATQKLSQYKVPGCPMVSYVSNQEKTDAGNPKLLGKAWHTDHSFQPEPPKATLLYGVKLPKRGGDTWFANMKLAYDTLPNKLKDRINGLEAIHAYRESREVMSKNERNAEILTDAEERKLNTVHPVIRTHDISGSKSIYLNPLRIKRFIGMSSDESSKLLERLILHSTKDNLVYVHRWQQGDVIIWDNRQAMHRVEHNYDLSEERLMHRIILKGIKPE